MYIKINKFKDLVSNQRTRGAVNLVRGKVYRAVNSEPRSLGIWVHVLVFVFHFGDGYTRWGELSVHTWFEVNKERKTQVRPLRISGVCLGFQISHLYTFPHLCIPWFAEYFSGTLHKKGVGPRNKRA